jgi:uncharacterized membrane protein
MTVLTAFYPTHAMAVRVLDSLRRFDEIGDIQLLDAATVTKDEASSRLAICDDIDTAASRAPATSPGGLISSILPEGVLSLGAVGAAASAADEHFAEQGFHANLLRELGENMPPGGAALIAVIEEKWVERFGDLIAGYADMDRFTLDAKAAAHLKERSRATPG